jgi:hypothetical protein
MNRSATFLTLLLSVAFLSVAYGWQVDPAAQSGGSSALSSMRRQQGGKLELQGTQPCVPGQSEFQPGKAQASEEIWPKYPYPAYHNPFYEGPPDKNLAAQALDWMMGVPSIFANAFAQFMDKQVYPRIPATHGGGGVQEKNVQDSESANVQKDSVTTK